MRLGFDSRRAHGCRRRLYSGIITDCGSVDPGSIPGRRTRRGAARVSVHSVLRDDVAERLTRSTANRFLSGAQVRVLPTSLFFFLFGRCGAKAACETSDLLIGVQFPAPSLEVFSSFGFGGSNPPLRFLCERR